MAPFDGLWDGNWAGVWLGLAEAVLEPDDIQAGSVRRRPFIAAWLPDLADALEEDEALLLCGAI
jgi:hypothetical protein